MTTVETDITQEDINDIFDFGLGPPSQVIEGVWLGAIKDAEDIDFVLGNIDSVISVTDSLQNVVVPDVNYRYFPLRCIPFWSEKGEREMADKAVKALHQEHEKGKRILIHCFAGIDRSPTVLLKFLSEKFDIKFRLAERMIAQARPVANPHLDWWSDKPLPLVK